MTSAQKGGGSRNSANLRTNSIDFAYREGERVKKSQNYVDGIYGSPLMPIKGRDPSFVCSVALRSFVIGYWTD